MFAFFLVPFAIIGEWMWFRMFLFIGVVFCFVEAYAYFVKGKTLTRRFREYREDNKDKALMVTASLIAGVLVLIYHLWK